MLRSRRTIHHEINAGSMADIAFLMLVFFLLTSTLDRNFAFTRQTPPPDNNTNAKQQQTGSRNMFTISINDNNDLSVNGKRVEAGDLKAKIIEFIQNPNESAALSEKQIVNVKMLGDVPVSKGIIAISTTDNTSYSAYINVNDIVNKAFAEMRDAFALRVFGLNYDKADELRKQSVDACVPLNITE